jgi:hypothetical protein
MAVGAANGETRFADGNKFLGPIGHYFKGKIDEFVINDPDESCYDVDEDGKCFAEDVCPYEYFNDPVSPGECGLANLCQVDAVTIPPPTFHVWEEIYYNIRLNGKAATYVKVSPGSSLTLVYDWKIDNGNDSCATCLQQFYTGWAGQAWADCFSVLRGPKPGNAGLDRTVTLQAPLQPGVYLISTNGSGLFSCDANIKIHTYPAYTIAAVCVQ